MTYRSLVITTDTPLSDILAQIDKSITINGSGNPNGAVAADRVGQIFVDVSASRFYWCSSTDNTIGGTSWQTLSGITIGDLGLGTAAFKNVGTGVNTVALGDHNHDTQYDALGTATTAAIAARDEAIASAVSTSEAFATSSIATAVAGLTSSLTTALADTLIDVNVTFTAVNRNVVLANTTAGPFNGLLPATPVHGNFIRFIDKKDTWSINPLTIVRNSSAKIMGLNEDLVCNIRGGAVALIYDGADNDWRISI